MAQWQSAVLKTQILKIGTSRQYFCDLFGRTWLFVFPVIRFSFHGSGWWRSDIYTYISVHNCIIEHVILSFSHKVIIPLGWKMTLAPPHDWKSNIISDFFLSQAYCFLRTHKWHFFSRDTFLPDERCVCVYVCHNYSLCRDYEATPCISEMSLTFLVAMKFSSHTYIQWLH